MKHPGSLADAGSVHAVRSIPKGSSLSLILEKSQSEVQVEVGSAWGAQSKREEMQHGARQLKDT